MPLAPWTVGAFIAATCLALAGSSLPSELIAEAESLRALDTAESLRRAALKFEEALPLWRQLGNTSDEAGTFHQLGLVYDSVGDRSRARNAFLEALRLRRTLRDRRGESASLTALAGVTEQLGELDRALHFLRQSLKLSRSIGDKLGEARALYRMGCIHDKVPKVRCAGYSCRLQALVCLRQALSLFQSAGDLRGQGDALSRAAMNYEGIGDRKKALEYLQLALDLHRRAGDRRGEGRVYYNLGYLHLWSGAYSQALESFQQALDLRRQAGDRAGELGTVMVMGRAAHGLGRLDEALRYFETSVEMVEAERKKLEGPDLRASYFSTKENYYGHYIDALMDLHQSEPSGGYAARALEASERMKARTLVEALGDSPPEAPFGIDQIRRQVLDHDTLLLEYARGVAELYVWAVSRTGTYGFRLGDINRIQASAVRWRGLLQRSRDDASLGKARDRAGAELSRLLLGPVAHLLGTKRLLMVMDATLQDLPLAALPKPGAGGAPLASANEIVGLPSARTLFVMRRAAASRPLAPKTVAVLADPVFDRHDPRAQGSNAGPPGVAGKGREGTHPRLPRLSFSRKEAAAIVSFASQEESLLAVDFAASRQTATSPLMGRYKIVHFATHGLVDPARPENSHLAFSLVDQAGTPQDGFLRLRDIYNLRLPVELVVLSACQTGLGKDVRGEGVISLARGFLAAGARRVLVSLWKVDDEATAEFMRQFYRAMLTGQKLAPAAALRAAQTAMWNNPRWQSPSHWSGFVLQGDWR